MIRPGVQPALLANAFRPHQIGVHVRVAGPRVQKLQNGMLTVNQIRRVEEHYDHSSSDKGPRTHLRRALHKNAPALVENASLALKIYVAAKDTQAVCLPSNKVVRDRAVGAIAIEELVHAPQGKNDPPFAAVKKP